jgi:hypothetical protein
VIGPVEIDDSPRVPAPNSETEDNTQPDIDQDPVEEPVEEEPTVEELPEEEQNGDTPISDFDFAAMVGEIQPISGSQMFGVVADQDQNRPTSDRVAVVEGPIQPKWIDLKNLDIKEFELEGLRQIDIPSAMDNAGFIEGLETVGQDLEDAAKKADANYKLGSEAALGVTLSLSAGFVSWALRAGSLMASFMSVVPMWKQLDPLPILGAAIVKGRKKAGEKSDRADPNGEVEELFDRKDPR